MSDRKTLDQMTSDDLDTLHEQIEAAEDLAEQHARNTLTVARERDSYRKAWKHEQQWRAHAEAAVERVRKLTVQARDHTAAGLDDYQIGRHDLAVDILATLDEPGPAAEAATQATEGPLAEQLRAAIEAAVYAHRELTCLWDEDDGTTEEIARRATQAVLSLLTPRALIDQTPAAPIVDRPFRSHRQPKEQP